MNKVTYMAAVMLTAFITFIVASPAAGKTNVLPDTSLPVQPFVVEDAYGHRIDLSQQKNKVVFINFWALSCVPCKAEMPTINNLAHHFKEDTNFLVLPVDLDRNFLTDIRYFNEEKFALNVYIPSGVVPQALFNGVLPTTVVIDKRGNIVLFHEEADKYDSPSFFKFIDSLLQQ